MTDMKTRLRRAFRLWQRNFDVYKGYYHSSLVGNIGEPLLYLFGFGLGIGAMVDKVDGVPYLEWIAPGLMAGSAMTSAALECTFGSYTRMVEQKVYEGILATPLEIEDIVLGEVMWGATKSMISAVLMLAVLSVAGLFDQWAAVIPLLLLMALFGFAFASLTLCITAMAKSYEFFNYFFTLFLTPMLIFSGIYFPSDRLPGWMANCMLLFPTPHAVCATRYLFHGGSWFMPIIGVVFLVAVIPPGVWLATRLVKRRLVPAA